VVSSTPQPHFTPGKGQVPILQEAGWAPGPVWTGGKSRPQRHSIPDRPTCSQLLYRLSYLAHTHTHTHTHICISICIYICMYINIHTHTHTHIYIHRVYDSYLCGFTCGRKLYEKVTLQFVLIIWFLVLSLFSTGLHPYLCMCDPSVHSP